MAYSFNYLKHPLGFYNKKTAQPQGYQFQPYGGARPEKPQYTAQSEKALYDTILPRSQGVGVGYDPQWLNENTNLLKSTIGQQEEDQLRSAQGSLSAAGLSGNPRAYEAMAGRVKRDTGRQLADSMSKINIADLERKNQERDTNTARLQGFNQFEFGQGNKVADFDLGVYNAEQGNQLSASAQALGQYNQDRAFTDQQQSELGQFGLSAASLVMGNPAPLIAGNALKSSGTGIAPESGLQTPSFYNQPLNSRNRRNVVR